MTREIPLTLGKVAIVDDEDYDLISKHSWQARKDGNVFYANTKTYGKVVGKRINIKMHHLILECPKGMQTDHIDGNGLNNQRSNLRIVSHRQNQCNQHVNKSSKYPGVCFDKHAGKFVAGIKLNGKRKSLGYSSDEFTAFQTYVVATVVLVGDTR